VLSLPENLVTSLLGYEMPVGVLPERKKDNKNMGSLLM